MPPTGDQLNLYLKLLGIAGNPPQYEWYVTSRLFKFFSFNCLTSRCEKNGQFLGQDQLHLQKLNYFF